MARNQRMKKEVNAEGQLVLFTFPSGESFEGKLADLSDEMKIRLALHGLSQKCGDAGALGKDASDSDIESAVRDQFDRLANGEWATRKAGEPKVTLVVKALARIKGIEENDAREKYAALDDDNKKLIRANPQVKKVMAEIRLEIETEKADKAGEGEGDNVAALEAF